MSKSIKASNDLERALLLDFYDHYESALGVFAQYSQNKRLVNYLLRSGNREFTRKKLRREMRDLLHDLDDGDVEIEETHKIQLPPMLSHSAPSILDPIEDAKQVIPSEIQHAMRERSKYANRRDKIHNELADDCSRFTQTARVDMVSSMKVAHEKAMQWHEIVLRWDETGEIPDDLPKEEPKFELLDADGLEEAIKKMNSNRVLKNYYTKKIDELEGIDTLQAEGEKLVQIAKLENLLMEHEVLKQQIKASRRNLRIQAKRNG